MVFFLPGSRSILVSGPVTLCVAIYVYLSTTINVSTASTGYQQKQDMAAEMAALSSASASVMEISVPTSTPLRKVNSTGIRSLKPQPPPQMVASSASVSSPSVVEMSVPTSTPILEMNSTGITSLKPQPPPIDVCFVSSIFAPTVKTADRPHDFSNFELTNTSSFEFFIYTNLEDLESPGWTKVLRNFTNYRRFITQSRWGKFMAWKDPEMKACQAIFYFDGHFTPSAKGERLVKLAESIKEYKFGLAQRQSPKRRTAIAEFKKILEKGKDIKKNVDASIEWLQAQPDFHNNCTLYRNANFGYDPTNVHFQEAAQYFWDHYSKEEDSWRDQPLWCHTLAHFHVKPMQMGQVFAPNYRRMGHKQHRYGVAQDNDAGAPKSSAANATSNASISVL
jgi:hypothetical protein